MYMYVCGMCAYIYTDVQDLVPGTQLFLIIFKKKRFSYAIPTVS